MFNANENNVKFDTLSFLLFLAWVLLGASLLSYPLLLIGPMITNLSLEEYKETVFMSHTYIPACIAGIIGIVAYCILYRKSIVKDGFNFKNKWWKYIILILASAAILYYLNVFFEFIYPLLGVPKDETSQNQQAIIDALNGSTKIFVIIYTVIVAPIIEEIVFRKLFYNVLKRYTKLPVWAIVLIISFVFAFIHVSDLASIKFLPQYFVLAFVITGVYAITKENIFASISLHGINNLIAVLQIVL